MCTFVEDHRIPMKLYSLVSCQRIQEWLWSLARHKSNRSSSKEEYRDDGYIYTLDIEVNREESTYTYKYVKSIPNGRLVDRIKYGKLFAVR